jgi:hypothetical protein
LGVRYKAKDYTREQACTARAVHPQETSQKLEPLCDPVGLKKCSFPNVLEQIIGPGEHTRSDFSLEFLS